MPFFKSNVIAIKNNKIQIESQQKPQCQSSDASCAQQPFAWRLWPAKALWLECHEPVQIGDTVVVSLPNSRYARLLLRLYGLPLIALWLGAGLGEGIATYVSGSPLVWGLGTSLALAVAAWRLNFHWPIPQIHIQMLKD